MALEADATKYGRWDNAGPWIDYSITPPTVGEGEHTIYFYSDDQAVDALGARNEETPQTRTVKLDTTFPTVAATSTTANGSYNAPDAINVTLTFSEPVSSTDALTVTLDTGGTCSVPVLTNTTTGTCTYIVGAAENSSDLTVTSIVPDSGVVEDVAGNDSTLIPTSNIADTSDIIIDTTSPSPFAVGTVAVTGGTVVSGWWNSTNTGVNVNVPVAVDSSLTGGTIQLQAEADGVYENVGSAYTILLGDLGTTKTLSLTAGELEAITGFSDGDNIQFKAIITDLAGNPTTGTESTDNFNVDQALPSVDAGTDEEVNTLVPQNATVSDSGSSGIASFLWTGPGTIVFGTPTAEDTTISAGTDGVYTITLTVADNAGNVASDTIQFAWDTIAPIITETTPVATPTNNTTPSYVFSVDSVKQLLASTGGAIIYGGSCGNGDLSSAVAGSNTTVYGPLSDATYSDCTIVVTDAAGNSSAPFSVSSFEIDTIAATVSSITTEDTDLNGSIDKATIVFNDEVKDSTFVAGNFTVGGVPATSFEAGVPNDNTIVLLLGTQVAGTNEKTVAYIPGSATDLAGNSIAGFSTTSTDLAGPILLSAETKTTTTIDTVWSEDLAGGTVNGSGNEFVVTGYPVSAASETSAGVVTLTVATMPTDATPLVTFSSALFRDLNLQDAPSPQSTTATDGVAPVLTAVSITSNANPIYAKEGDTITLTFTSSEAISSPTVLIQGVAATSVTNIGNDWTASRVMLLADTQGPVIFSIDFEDVSPATNNGITVTAVTDASAVFFDSVDPLVNAGTDKEVNAMVSQDATVSDPAPSSGGLVYAWTQQSGPGTITFGTPTTEDTTILADTDGTYTARLTVTDNAGNVTYDEMTFIWDTTNPEPLTASPSDGATGISTASGTATVTFDEDVVLLDASRVLLVNDATNASYKSAVSVLGGNGASAILNIDYSGLAFGTKYRINVKPNAILDVATNKLASNFISYFTTVADTTPPIVNSSSASSITATGATLNVTTNENANCRYATTDSSYASMTPFSTTGTTSHTSEVSGLLSSTGYDFYVRCADTSIQANEMTTSAHIAFTTLTLIDTTAPEIPVFTTASTTTDADTYTVAGTDANDGGNRTISVYNGATLAGTTNVPAGQTAWSLLVPLTQNSANVFTATASDTAGNTSVPSSPITITEATTPGDTTDPAIPVITTTETTVDANEYTISGTAGADLPTDGSRTITIYNNGVVMGSIVLLEGETDWSFVATLNQNTENSFIAYSTDQSGNTSDPSDYVIITEETSADTTPPVISNVQTNPVGITSATITWTTNELSDSQVEYGLTSAYGTSTAVDSTLTTSHAVVVSGLTSNTMYHFRVKSADASDNTGISEHDMFTTAVDDSTAILEVTGISAIKTYATADNTYANGWSWTFNITVPTTETLFHMKFADWTSSLNTISVANNIRYSSAQSSTSPVEITAANTYGGDLDLNSDLDSGTPGRQIQVLVEAKVPEGSAGGSYSTSYGIESNQD